MRAVGLLPAFTGNVGKPGAGFYYLNDTAAFAGIDGYGDTFRYGCKVGGCTVHFIDYGEDSGPIIGQQAFQIQSDDTLESIRKKGLKLEWELFPACIQLFAEGRLKLVIHSFDLGGGKKKTRKIVVVEGSKDRR